MLTYKLIVVKRLFAFFVKFWYNKNMNKLEIKSLYLQYKYGALALQNINFEVSEGQIFTVLAPSEGGKTSLIKGLAGLYPILRGEAILNGKVMNNLPIKQRNITVMYEDGCLFKHKSVTDNLVFPLKIRKIDKTQARNTVNQIIEEFDLTECENTRISKLDRTLKFKVALARLFVRQSELYLIDDPLKVFSVEERKLHFDYLYPNLIKLSKIAPVIYATSSVDESAVLGDRVALLNYGVQLQSGNINELITHPNNALAYKMFHSGAVSAEVVLAQSGEDVYIELDGNKIFLNRAKLLNGIYIDGKVLVCYMVNSDGIDIPTLRLFDVNSEKLIYFN